MPMQHFEQSHWEGRTLTITSSGAVSDREIERMSGASWWQGFSTVGVTVLAGIYTTLLVRGNVDPEVLNVLFGYGLAAWSIYELFDLHSLNTKTQTLRDAQAGAIVDEHTLQKARIYRRTARHLD